MGAQVELFEHTAAFGVDENRIIGKIIGDEQLVRCAVAGDRRKAARIRDSGAIGGFARPLWDFLSRRGPLRRNLYEAIPSQLALMKAINRNPIPGIAGLFTSRVCDGTDRGIEMFAVGAEGKSNEITLVSVYRPANFPGIGE